MKKTVLFLLLFTLCFGSAYAYVDPCPNDNHDYSQLVHATEEPLDYLPDLFGHQMKYKIYHQCSNCGALKFRDYGYEDQDDYFSHFEWKNDTDENNATHHWKVGTSVGKCKCGKTKTLGRDLQHDYAPHTANSAVWYDAGHVGTKHYYDSICTKPACNSIRFRWRTINCPDPDHHIAPNGITPPVVTE